MGSEVEVGPSRIESEESPGKAVSFQGPPPPIDLIDRPPRSTSNFRVRVRVRVRVSVRVEQSTCHTGVSDTESTRKVSSKFRH